MKKIYIVYKHNAAEYYDTPEHLKAFESKKDAENYQERLKAVYQKLHDFYDEKSEYRSSEEIMNMPDDDWTIYDRFSTKKNQYSLNYTFGIEELPLVGRLEDMIKKSEKILNNILKEITDEEWIEIQKRVTKIIKVKTPFDKANSTFQKHINKLNKDIQNIQAVALRRKREITKYSNFVHQLVEDGKITKEELKVLFTRNNC